MGIFFLLFSPLAAATATFWRILDRGFNKPELTRWASLYSIWPTWVYASFYFLICSAFAEVLYIAVPLPSDAYLRSDADDHYAFLALVALLLTFLFARFSIFEIRTHDGESIAIGPAGIRKFLLDQIESKQIKAALINLNSFRRSLGQHELCLDIAQDGRKWSLQRIGTLDRKRALEVFGIKSVASIIDDENLNSAAVEIRDNPSLRLALSTVLRERILDIDPIQPETTNIQSHSGHENDPSKLRQQTLDALTKLKFLGLVEFDQNNLLGSTAFRVSPTSDGILIGDVFGMRSPLRSIIG